MQLFSKLYVLAWCKMKTNASIKRRGAKLFVWICVMTGAIVANLLSSHKVWEVLEGK